MSVSLPHTHTHTHNHTHHTHTHHTLKHMATVWSRYQGFKPRLLSGYCCWFMSVFLFYTITNTRTYTHTTLNEGTLYELRPWDIELSNTEINSLSSPTCALIGEEIASLWQPTTILQAACQQTHIIFHQQISQPYLGNVLLMFLSVLQASLTSTLNGSLIEVD